jgi:hypothetical protein
VPGSLEKKGEERWNKDGIFFPPFLSNETGTGNPCFCIGLLSKNI